MEETLTYSDVLLKPQRGVLTKREHADIGSEVVPGVAIDVPILSANMPSVTGVEMAQAMAMAGGYGVLHRFNQVGDALLEYGKAASEHLAGVSLGLKDGIYRAGKFVDNGFSPVFFLDIAHGHHDQVLGFITEFRHEFGRDAKLVVGNIATKEAVYDFAPFLVNGFKVGVGPGAACTTREVTGFGVGQLSAVLEVTEALDYLYGEGRERPTLIADGGIQSSGDIVKALAAGADTVMVGRLFAGCDEAPDPGVYYGNASKKMNGHHAPEGVHGTVEKTGPVADVMKTLAWGIRSGVSYGGATNLKELRENAEFLRVSTHTSIESGTRI